MYIKIFLNKILLFIFALSFYLTGCSKSNNVIRWADDAGDIAVGEYEEDVKNPLGDICYTKVDIFTGSMCLGIADAKTLKKMRDKNSFFSKIGAKNCFQIKVVGAQRDCNGAFDAYKSGYEDTARMINEYNQPIRQ